MNKTFLILIMGACALSACSADKSTLAIPGKAGPETPALIESSNRNKIKNHSGAEVQPDHTGESASQNSHDLAVTKLIRESELKSKIKEIELQNKVDCMGPRLSQIHWMCMNGPTCGFSLDITCISKVDTSTSNDQILRVSYFGMSDAEKGTAQFESIAPTLKRYKLEETSSNP
jgi:hypothetical protein